MLSELYARNGRGEEALVLCRASVETNRALEYGNMVGRLFATLGFIYKALGRQDETEQTVRESVELAHGKDVALEAWCGWVAGQVLADPREAVRQLEQALAIAERLEMRPLAALCRVEMSRRRPGTEANRLLVELRALGMDGLNWLFALLLHSRIEKAAHKGANAASCTLASLGRNVQPIPVIHIARLHTEQNGKSKHSPWLASPAHDARCSARTHRRRV